ncbi:MAG: hypothetical protein Unbinned4350contig1002_20 [Prokaryotic dsDNA virus sp.]|nr:MAG: hypothetical protein Unbinned4350contig1002_20 [Prokaryotic dsDNA virus sp.]
MTNPKGATPNAAAVVVGKLRILAGSGWKPVNPFARTFGDALNIGQGFPNAARAIPKGFAAANANRAKFRRRLRHNVTTATCQRRAQSFESKEDKETDNSCGPPFIAPAANGPTVINSRPTAAAALVAVKVAPPTVALTVTAFAADKGDPFSTKATTLKEAQAGLPAATSKGI